MHWMTWRAISDSPYLDHRLEFVVLDLHRLLGSGSCPPRRILKPRSFSKMAPDDVASVILESLPSRASS